MFLLSFAVGRFDFGRPNVQAPNDDKVLLLIPSVVLSGRKLQILTEPQYGVFSLRPPVDNKKALIAFLKTP